MHFEVVRRRSRTFVVALLVVLAGCSGITSPGSKGTVTLQSLSLTGCAGSASPLPGWVNCSASVTLNVTKTVSSGYVSVYFNYPDAGSFYHGQVQVSAGAPGTIVVPMINEYVGSCATSLQTSVGVYDGPESNSSAPQMATIPTSITATC